MAGSLLVLSCRNTAAPTISSVVDDHGNTWLRVGSRVVGPGTVSLDIFYVVANASGGALNVTVTYSANATLAADILEYTGQAAAPLDTFVTGTGTSASPAAGPVTPGFTNEGNIFCVGTDQAPTITAGAGYTNRTNQGTNTGGDAGDNLAPAVGAQSTTWTVNSGAGTNWATMLLLFSSATPLSLAGGSWLDLNQPLKISQ